MSKKQCAYCRKGNSLFNRLKVISYTQYEHDHFGDPLKYICNRCDSKKAARLLV